MLLAKMNNQTDSFQNDYGKKTTRGLKGLFNSFKYAFSGFCYCMFNERNMRIHMIASMFVITFSPFYNFTKEQYGILLSICALVIVMEMINTAVEGICNYISPGYSEMARIVKDIVAGAVFLTSAVAVVIGAIFFGNIQVIIKIATFLYSQPLACVVLVFTIACSVLFIKDR